MRNEAEFKALRELVGMSQSMLADTLGVRVLSVKRWENPNYDWRPPDEAWEVLDRARAKQLEVVRFAVFKVKGLENQAGERPGTVNLTYWRSEDEYEAAHPGEGAKWQMANANSRLVCHELERLGYSVAFGFGGLASLEEQKDN